MRCCFIFHENDELRVGNMECSDAPPHIEFKDHRRVISVTRVLERLTGTVDPVNGIVLYEEVVR